MTKGEAQSRLGGTDGLFTKPSRVEDSQAHEVVQMYDSVSAKSRQRIEGKMEEMQERQTREAVQEIIEFNRTPSDLKGQVDQFVIGQEKGKKVISTAIAFHYRRLGKALKEAIVESGD
ncbi:MAG: hypothetical protein NWE78_04475, partial [Candidatus Bathyarchaeota archaeon]|nr:hypothetical protein [Candidatus Bathyarchaeota archaeon]